MHSAFVQVAAEESEQVWRQEEWLHQWTLGQLACHLEYAVCPKKARQISCDKNKKGAIKDHHTRSQSHRCWAPEELQRTVASLLVTGEHTARKVQTGRLEEVESDVFHTKRHAVSVGHQYWGADLVLTCQCQRLARRQREIFEDAD